MDNVAAVLAHPFTWGLLLGLLIAGSAWRSAHGARATLKRDVKRLEAELAALRDHLNTHLKITASGNDQREQEIAALKNQNENLRINVASLQQKPGRAELRQLRILEGAVRRMREQAPGFAAAWEQAVRDSTADEDGAERGITGFIRKAFAGPEAPASRRPTSKPAALIEDEPSPSK